MTEEKKQNNEVENNKEENILTDIANKPLIESKIENIEKDINENKTTSSQNDKEIDFENKKKSVDELKKELDLLNSEKEKWFLEKDKYSKEIKSKIFQIKELKQKRDVLTNSVKEKKKEKEPIDKNINEILEELKKVKAERDSIYKKHNLSGTPDLINNQIKKLEKYIETEVISFDKEKKIMKQINELKSKLSEFKVVFDINDKIKDINKKLRDLKNNKKDFSIFIKKNASESQKYHNQLIELSKEVDILKKSEEEAFNKFSDFKKKFNEVNYILKSHYSDLNIIKDQYRKKKDKDNKIKYELQKKTLEEKHIEVEQKIKKGKKLTTADLLAFQGVNK
jgi:uncharacterized coiled-coil DUF342 family protein